MKFVSDKCRFLCKETRQSKNRPDSNYYLYTFMSEGKILPAFYSTDDLNVDGIQDCTLKVEASAFDNRVNLKLIGIEKYGK